MLLLKKVVSQLFSRILVKSHCGSSTLWKRFQGRCQELQHAIQSIKSTMKLEIIQTVINNFLFEDLIMPNEEFIVGYILTFRISETGMPVGDWK